MSRLFVAVGDGAERLDPSAALRDAEGVLPDRLEVFCEPRLVVGVAARFTEPEDRDAPAVIVSDDLVLAFDGRIDARAELIERLGVSPASSSAQLALAAVRRFGRDAARHIAGDFAWVAVDRRTGFVLAARDRFGVRPLCFAERGTLLAFASTDRLLFQIAGVPRRPDREVIGWALIDAFVSQDGRSLYRDLRSLPPGHELELRGGALSMHRYFEPDPYRIASSLSERQHQERLVEALTLAVHDRVRGDHTIGAECSGGLDSGTCVVLAADRLAALGRPPPLLLHMQATGFPACDESRHARLVAQLTQAPILIADGSDAFGPDPAPEVDLPDVFAASSRELFGAAAKQGARVVLTGDGSDELQSAWQLGVDDALVRRDARGALDLAGLLEQPLSAGRWLSLLRAVARTAAPSELLAARHAQLSRASLPAWLSQGGRSFASEASAALTERARAFAHPSRMRQEICNALVNSPSVTWITPTNHQFASYHGIDLSCPFTDIRVVDAFLELPTELRTSFELSKPLLRRAFAGRLPPGVAWRRPAADYSPLFEAAYMKARDRWLALVRNSCLAALGLVEHSAFERAVVSGLEAGWLGFRLRNALRLENWLVSFR